MKLTETRQLPCKLSEKMLLEKITELGDLTSNTGRINELEANYRNEVKLARAHNAERIKTVTREIQKKVGLIPVICEVRPNIDKGYYEVVRLDLGKVIECIPMTADEMEKYAPPVLSGDAGQNHADVLEGKA